MIPGARKTTKGEVVALTIVNIESLMAARLISDTGLALKKAQRIAKIIRGGKKGQTDLLNVITTTATTSRRLHRSLALKTRVQSWAFPRKA